MKHLAPKARWLFFVQPIIAFTILYALFGLYFGIGIAAILFRDSGTGSVITVAIGVNVIIYILIILASLFWSKLAYNNYKYEMREDGFRKESGVVWKKYVTVPYERIQNVDIYRGIMARILGLSDLHIQTAGNSVVSGRFGKGSEGRLPGLSIQDAETLRDELVKRSRGQQANQSQTKPQPNPQSNQGL